jgi:hypothetical protein
MIDTNSQLQRFQSIILDFKSLRFAVIPVLLSLFILFVLNLTIAISFNVSFFFVILSTVLIYPIMEEALRAVSIDKYLRKSGPVNFLFASLSFSLLWFIIEAVLKFDSRAIEASYFFGLQGLGVLQPFFVHLFSTVCLMRQVKLKLPRNTWLFVVCGVHMFYNMSVWTGIAISKFMQLEIDIKDYLSITLLIASAWVIYSVGRVSKATAENASPSAH